jgi:predicted DNA-binding transcriptional regulator YafY
MKIERLLSIVILLLDSPIVSASALAKQFEVTKRTIYRDMETLEHAGFPIISYPGINGGFGFLDTFKMHKFTFNDIEKQRILEALNIHEQLLSFQESDTLIKNKVFATQEFDARKANISFSSATLHNSFIEQATTKKLELLHPALLQHQKIKITYITTAGNSSERYILPIKLLLQNGSWYLEAYCELRKAYRLFKVTRMRTMEVLDIFFDITSLPIKTDTTDTNMEIQLSFCKNTLGKLYDFFSEENMNIQKEHILVTFLYPITGNLIPFLLMFGNQVQVLSPSYLKEKHIVAIEKMNKIYK